MNVAEKASSETSHFTLLILQTPCPTINFFNILFWRVKSLEELSAVGQQSYDRSPCFLEGWLWGPSKSMENLSLHQKPWPPPRFEWLSIAGKV